MRWTIDELIRLYSVCERDEKCFIKAVDVITKKMEESNRQLQADMNSDPETCNG